MAHADAYNKAWNDGFEAGRRSMFGEFKAYAVEPNTRESSKLTLADRILLYLTASMKRDQEAGGDGNRTTREVADNTGSYNTPEVRRALDKLRATGSVYCKVGTEWLLLWRLAQ